MTDPAEKIVVFDTFDNVIKANIIKTKLDAYGIPCFLTDENFVNLYPIRNELTPGVRLYIFERDRERVREVLVEEQWIPEAEVIRCPRCQSTNVVYEQAKKRWHGGPWLLALSVLLVFPFTQRKKVYHCRECDAEFSP
jgi:DNA-directed RNA polymerase subunit RPC12/RpoP